MASLLKTVFGEFTEESMIYIQDGPSALGIMGSQFFESERVRFLTTPGDERLECKITGSNIVSRFGHTEWELTGMVVRCASAAFINKRFFALLDTKTRNGMFQLCPKD